MGAKSRPLDHCAFIRLGCNGRAHNSAGKCYNADCLCVCVCERVSYFCADKIWKFTVQYACVYITGIPTRTCVRRRENDLPAEGWRPPTVGTFVFARSFLLLFFFGNRFFSHSFGYHIKINERRALYIYIIQHSIVLDGAYWTFVGCLSPSSLAIRVYRKIQKFNCSTTIYVCCMENTHTNTDMQRFICVQFAFLRCYTLFALVSFHYGLSCVHAFVL